MPYFWVLGGALVNSGLKEYNDLNRVVKLCGGVSKYKALWSIEAVFRVLR